MPIWIASSGMIPYIILFHILFILLVWSLIKTMITDPVIIIINFIYILTIFKNKKNKKKKNFFFLTFF